MPATATSDRSRARGMGTGLSGGERRPAAAARRAVVEVLLHQLVAPVAEPEVLDRPRQLGRRGLERQQLADDLELLARLAIAVDAVGLGLDDDLAPGRRAAHAIALERHE